MCFGMGMKIEIGSNNTGEEGQWNEYIVLTDYCFASLCFLLYLMRLPVHEC